MSVERKSSADTSSGNGRAVRDDLADRLIEKREKFQYFVITGATAVIVFTFNNFNDPNGVLKLGPHWMTITGWFVLLLSAGAALGLFPLRHARYASFLDLLERGERKPAGKLQERERTTRTQVRVAEWVMGLSFVTGVSLLTMSAAIGIARLS